MILSVGIIAMNEEEFLPMLLDDILNQKVDLSKVELILVDSMSKDNTKSIMKEFQKKFISKFYDIQVLQNEKKIQAAGWNVIIENFQGVTLTRLDAHSRICDDFLKEIQKALLAGENVVGGPRPNILVDNATLLQALLFESENLKIGSGVNRARRESDKTYVNSMFHATYAKKVIEKTGLFNENLLRTEDNEYHYRVRKNGYLLFFTNKIKSFQYARPNLKGYFKQKYGNGYWIGKTLLYNYNIVEWYHLVPFFFIIYVLSSLFLIKNSLFATQFVFVMTLYIMLLLSGALRLVISKRKIPYLLVPVIVLSTHITYGIGTICGIINTLVVNTKKLLN